MPPDIALEALIEQLKDQNFKVSQKAEQRLIELNDPASFPLLVEVLKGDDVCNCHAANILLKLRGSDAIPDVLDAMANPPWWDDQDGMAAIVADYFEAAGKTASASLVSALQSPDAKIRRVAAWGLDYVYDADTIPALIAAINNDPDTQVQNSAASSLAHFRDMPDFHEKLMEALNPDAQRLVREEITYIEQLQRSMEDQRRNRMREPIIRTAIAVVLLIAILAIAIIGKVR